MRAQCAQNMHTWEEKARWWCCKHNALENSAPRQLTPHVQFTTPWCLPSVANHSQPSPALPDVDVAILFIALLERVQVSVRTRNMPHAALIPLAVHRLKQVSNKRVSATPELL